MNKLIFFMIITFLLRCNSDTETKKIPKIKSTVSNLVNEKNMNIIGSTTPIKFGRSASLKRIKDKIANDKPLVIHVRVPLCDNDNQGIVKVSPKLGDGFNLKSNLYWGAKYGIKNHFKRYTDWEFIESIKEVNKEVLERIIFRKKFSNKANVYLIADAYQGDKMKDCVLDFMNSISGNKKGYIDVKGQKIGINGNSDLLVFNGHNGLMDYNVKFIPSKDDVIREVSVIGCISHDYFKDHLLYSKGYPILMTTNLMAPEAYVLESLVNSWSKLNTEDEIKNAAGIYYDKYQKCGIKGATRLFRNGW